MGEGSWGQGGLSPHNPSPCSAHPSCRTETQWHLIAEGIAWPWGAQELWEWGWSNTSPGLCSRGLGAARCPIALLVPRLSVCLGTLQMDIQQREWGGCGDPQSLILLYSLLLLLKCHKSSHADANLQEEKKNTTNKRISHLIVEHKNIAGSLKLHEYGNEIHGYPCR